MNKQMLILLAPMLASLACMTTLPDGKSALTAVPAASLSQEPESGEVFVIQEREPTVKNKTDCAQVIAETALHLRKDPGAHQQILSYLTNGQTVKVINRDDPDWWKISDGFLIGYAKAEYLKESECTDD